MLKILRSFLTTFPKGVNMTTKAVDLRHTTTDYKSDVPDSPTHKSKHGSSSSSITITAGNTKPVTDETRASSAPAKDCLKPIAGFTDYTEGQHYLFNQWMRKVADAYAKYGFTSFTPRPVELASNLMVGGIGHQVYGVYRLSDRVNAEKQGTAKETLDDETTRFALPYDRTVPLAIFVASKINQITFPYKRQHIEYSFRGEHAQPGRFRGFYQCDADIIDRHLNPLAEYECLMAMIEALKSLNVGPFVVSINDIKIARALIKEAGIPEEHEKQVLREIDKMDKLPPSEVVDNICKLLLDGFSRSQIEALVGKFGFKGAPQDFPLDKDTSAEVRQAYRDLGDVYGKLVRSGVRPESLQVNFGMVRGLDYYTGIVFETHIVGKEKFGSVASGGRYDNLVGAFSEKNKDMQGLGGSIGLTRLFHVLQVEPDVEIPRKSVANFLVGYRTVALQNKAVEIASALRQQGINVDLYTNPKGKVKDQFGYANSKGIPNAIMVMDEGALVLKDMANGRDDKGTEYASVQELVSAAVKQNKQQEHNAQIEIVSAAPSENKQQEEAIEQISSGFKKIKGKQKEIDSVKKSYFY